MSWRSRQQALTLICSVRSEARDALLADLERSSEPFQAVFRSLITLHTARLLLVPAGERVELVLQFAFDGPLAEFSEALWARGGGALARVFEHCELERAPHDAASFHRFAVQRSLRAGAAYTAHDGLSATRIRNDAALDRLLQVELDRSHSLEAVAGLGPFEIAATLQARARAEPGLRLGGVARLADARDPGAPLRGRHLELLAAAAVLPLLELWSALRALAEPRSPAPPPPEVRELSRTRGALVHLAQIKPGRLRWFVLNLVLWLLHGWLRQRPVAEGHALEQVHELRWLILPGRRLLCLAHTDVGASALVARLGQAERRALSLLWLQTVGFPGGVAALAFGSRREARLRRWLDESLLPTQIFFSAYQALAATEIERNHRVRELLSGDLNPERAVELCALL